jgi:hypothetical protein
LFDTVNALSRFNRIAALFLFAAGGVALCAVIGCRSLPRSGFDPTGERLFEQCPLSRSNLGNCELLGRRKTPPTTVTATQPSATETNPSGAVPASIDPSATAESAQVYSPTPAAGLPGNIGGGRTNPGVPQYGSTATAVPPGTHAVTTAVITSPDTTVKQPFTETGGYALPVVPVQGPALIMTPREQIAPIGSEVVLISSYLGSRDRLVTNEKIEWTLEGAGTIEQFDPGSHCDPFFGDCVRAKKHSGSYAVTKTSQVYRTLDRGTANTADDIHLLRGQTWITVNSLKEGTTHVTAFAPSLADWAKRTDVGIIHWVDAQWIIPRLSMAPVGESRALTTTVLRATNGQPRRGWIVRYEILNGPSAGLGATNAQIEELETDISGQATAILTPAAQTSGTNTVRISIIRPQGLDGSQQRITVGSEIVRQAWSGKANVTVNIQGPPTAKIGEELPYRIAINNRTSQYVQGMVLLPIPPVASYVRSNPPGQVSEQTVYWNVNVPPNSSSDIDVTVRQGASGSLWLRPEFRQTAAAAVIPSTPSPAVPAAGTPAVQRPPRRPQGTQPQGTQPQSPLDVPPPSFGNAAAQPPAQTFQPKPPAGQPLPLTLRVEVDPDMKIAKGEPFNFYFYVTNNGTSEISKVRLEVPLPELFRNTSLMATSEPSGVKLDVARHTVVLDNVTILPKGSVHIVLQYPTIDTQGYDITGEVLVNGQSAGKITERIAP